MTDLSILVGESVSNITFFISYALAVSKIKDYSRLSVQEKKW